MSHVITWFEIPVHDMARACEFYGALFGAPLTQVPMGERTLAMFPAAWDKGEIGGALLAGPDVKPSPDGTLVYLNGGEDLQRLLDKIPGAGGKVLIPKTPIPMEGAGFMALFADTEGNRVGLSSPR